MIQIGRIPRPRRPGIILRLALSPPSTRLFHREGAPGKGPGARSLLAEIPYSFGNLHANRDECTSYD